MRAARATPSNAGQGAAGGAPTASAARRLKGRWGSRSELRNSLRDPPPRQSRASDRLSRGTNMLTVAAKHESKRCFQPFMALNAWSAASRVRSTSASVWAIDR
jgi:hypothetical protein